MDYDENEIPKYRDDFVLKIDTFALRQNNSINVEK